MVLSANQPYFILLRTQLMLTSMRYFTIHNECSVSTASRGLAFNKAPVASTALSMSEVADAAVAPTTAEEDPAVMRPPIDMPWESVSEQVRIRMFHI